MSIHLSDEKARALVLPLYQHCCHLLPRVTLCAETPLSPLSVSTLGSIFQPRNLNPSLKQNKKSSRVFCFFFHVFLHFISQYLPPPLRPHFPSLRKGTPPPGINPTLSHLPLRPDKATQLGEHNPQTGKSFRDSPHSHCWGTCKETKLHICSMCVGT